MLEGKRVVVVLPAYNAEQTLRQTVDEIDRKVVDDVILVDDGSHDRTVAVARQLGLHVFAHEQNRGYGANQKTCYREALQCGADVVVMVHPDYQYDPRLVPCLAIPIAFGIYDCMIGSRIIGRTSALRGGMPLYKYVSNRLLTAIQNLLIGSKLSEFHTGYRAFSAEVLRSLPLGVNSDGFVFDNEMLCQVHYFGYRIGEVSCPTRYFEEASSISFWPSVRYGLGVLSTSLKFRVHKTLGLKHPLFVGDSIHILRPDAPELEAPP